MAELNRQLQEYLAQSKGGGAKTISQSTRAQAETVDFPGRGRPSLILGWSRGQRLLAFSVCVSFSALCFGLSALYAPLLLLYARKFALLWSLGSLFAIAAAAMLRGPSRLIVGLPTSPGAAVYLCALGGTLYAALSLHSTVLTALGAALQVAVIVGYVVSLLPGGSAGIRFMGGMAGSPVKRTLTGKTMPI
uniref:Vesicle transport protein n=1 Tax=Monopterus albus TaxID=43700 RepID=A0A3Q3J9T5_MONAL